MFDYYFFDLDGTLTNPALGITNSFIHAIKYFGLEVPSYKKLCTFIGPPLVYTFENAINLEKIELTQYMTSIAPSAFEGCIKLADIELPINIVKIGDAAFMTMPMMADSM